MNHLQSLTDLLSLASLSPDVLDKILDHDRWRIETVLDHEFRIEELRQQYLHGSCSSESLTFCQDDLTFNLVSSYSECNDAQIFKIAKTKVKIGITRLCEDRCNEIDIALVRNPRYKNVPNKDKSVNVMKQLIISIIHLSCCSERFKKWPVAKDKSSILQIQKDLELRVSRLNSLTFIVAYETVKQAWLDLFEGKIDFNDSDLKQMLDNAVSEIDSKEEVARKSNIKTSPLFALTSEIMPEINLDRLEQYYYTLGGKYIEAGLKTLALHFAQNRPPELDSTDKYAKWSDVYINYLQEYKEKWKNQLKEIEIDSWNDQLKWQKELTS
jgi:hypothetical protein